MHQGRHGHVDRPVRPPPHSAAGAIWCFGAMPGRRLNTGPRSVPTPPGLWTADKTLDRRRRSEVTRSALISEFLGRRPVVVREVSGAERVGSFVIRHQSSFD